MERVQSEEDFFELVEDMEAEGLLCFLHEFNVLEWNEEELKEKLDKCLENAADATQKRIYSDLGLESSARLLRLKEIGDTLRYLHKQAIGKEIED